MYIKQSDKRKTYIIEGEPRDNGSALKDFVIKRFICEVQQQETLKETEEVADLILNALIQQK